MFASAFTFLSRLLLLTIFAVATGTISSLTAILFVNSIAFLNDWLLISPRSRMMLDNAVFLNVATICIPTLGGLIVGLLWRTVQEKRPLGPPDAIYAVHTDADTLTARSGILTTVGSVISLGCGASVGQYGPLVVMGSAIGSWIGSHLKRLSISARELGAIGIGCGAASVIATAFNAPIAGLVFAHEVVLRHYSIRAFAPVTVAATVGYVMANGVFQLPPIFRIDAVIVSSPAEYLVFVAIGILGALVAVTFMHAILFSGKIAQRLPVPVYWRPAIAGAVLGAVAIAQPEILGIGSDLLRFTTIDGAFTLNDLTLLLLLKIFLTAVCIGFGFAGGVFSPALLIGALFGALVCVLVQQAGMLLPIGQGGIALSSVAIYAVCGMVAVTSPVIGAPLTTILVVFELTRNYDLALACMTSVVFANLLGYRLFGRSLFDVQLKARGMDLSLGRDKTLLELIPIRQYLSQNYISCRYDASLQQVCDALVLANRSEAYILDDSDRYIGTVTSLMILQVVTTDQNLRSASGHAVPEDLVIDIDSTVLRVMNSIKDFVGESVPVIDQKQGGKLVGVIYEADLVTAYLDTVTLAREQEHAGA